MQASLAFFRVAIGKTRITEPSPDCQNRPALAVLHTRQFAQALHHGVVVHDDHRFGFSDLRDARLDRAGQMEALALPIAGKILTAAINRAILADDARAADPD